MGKQYNKLQKRARRKAYLERVKAKARAAMKSAKKKSQSLRSDFSSSYYKFLLIIILNSVCFRTASYRKGVILYG